MDMKKTGAFLKSLRKEKGLTQEQLAEKLNISNRTVSRWETGTNLPDIDVLIELADFYGVNIKEIIDGEAKEAETENPSQTVRSVAGYSAEKEKNLLRKTISIVITGIAAWVISLCVILAFLSSVKDGILILIFTGIAFLFYCAFVLLNKKNRTASGYLNFICGAFCAVTASNILLLSVFFDGGGYINRGLAGVLYAFVIIFSVFLIAAATVTVINSRKSAKYRRNLTDIKN